MLEIYVWPDGNWMWKEDYCENGDRYKGDDFFSIAVEEDLEEDDITKLVMEAL